MKKWIQYPFYHDDVPVDISFVFEQEKPAGKHGFLKTEGRSFVFEDGTKVRFWGTNFNGAGCFPEHGYAEALAKRLTKIGINLVRFHQLDAEWHTPNIFAFTKGKRRTDAALDPQSMDRLDYLIHCLKKEGIYCYMDMFTYREFKTNENVDNTREIKEAAKPYCIFDDHLIELQKDLCRRLWTHQNPYTGLAYCDDPVFVLAEVVNECDLFSRGQTVDIPVYRERFLQKFDQWLTKNNISRKASEFNLDDFMDETLIDFKTYLQETYYITMQKYMRECGVKIPITGNNWTSSPANIKTQLITDYMDDHAYYYDWSWREYEKRCMNRGITQTQDSFLANCAMSTALDRPTYISEWDMPWPNEYRAESPLYCAAVGMLQDWSGFAIHTYSYSARLERMQMLGLEVSCSKIGNVPFRSGVFSTWNDPAKFGLFYHAALITRRGDVSPAKNILMNAPISKALWNKKFAETYLEESQVITDLSTLWKNQDEQMTEKAIAVDSFEVPLPERSEVYSDTGELYRNWKQNYGTINTPMTKCAYGFLAKNGSRELSGVTIDCATDFAVIAMSSLTNDAIVASDNILLTAVGRAQNTNWRAEGELMHDIGKHPVLIEAIEADITIKTGVSGLQVWAISAEGYVIGNLPTTYEDGKLHFAIGKEALTMYYLINKK